MIVIRPAVDDDRERIAALLNEGGDPGTAQVARDDSTHERFSRSLVASSGGDIVGYGSIFSRWLHPQRLRMEIHVMQDSAQSQVRDELFSHLTLCIPGSDTRELQANYWQSDLDAQAFWDAHGFSSLMRTRIGTLDPRLLVPEDLRMSYDRQQVQIVSGSEISSDRSLWNEVALLHEAIYRQNHAWSVPAPIDVELAKNLFLSPDDLFPDMMHIALDSGRPVAVASLRPSDREGHCELGWLGVHHEYAKDTGIVHHLLAACLIDARSRNWQIDVEIDEADPVLAPLIATWPLRDRKTWLTISRPQPSR